MTTTQAVVLVLAITGWWISALSMCLVRYEIFLLYRHRGHWWITSVFLVHLNSESDGFSDSLPTPETEAERSLMERLLQLKAHA